MRTATAVVGLMLCCSPATGDDKETWKEYASNEGRFKVLFPSDPEIAKIANQKPELHRAGVKRASADGLAYLCYWSIKDRPHANKEAAVAYLKGVQEGVVKGSKGVLDGDKELSLDGLIGREFFIRISERTYVRFRTIVSGKYAYTLQVWGKDRTAVTGQDAEEFLKSFVVIRPSDQNGGK